MLWDNGTKLKNACDRLADAGIEVSLFIDADQKQIEMSAEVGAPAIEIHTGHFADCENDIDANKELKRIVLGVEQGIDAGLIVNAGHGLHYHNAEVIAAIPQINELNIGHALIARAMFTGLPEAVREMKRIMREARL